MYGRTLRTVARGAYRPVRPGRPFAGGVSVEVGSVSVPVGPAATYAAGWALYPYISQSLEVSAPTAPVSALGRAPQPVVNTLSQPGRAQAAYQASGTAPVVQMPRTIDVGRVVGVFSGLVPPISVSGTSVGSVPNSPTFFTGAPGAAGQAVLAWDLPLRKVDGSALGALTAVTVYHGTTRGEQRPGGAGTPVTLSASATGTTIIGLPAGLRYFTVTASDSVGTSRPSIEISVTVS